MPVKNAEGYAPSDVKLREQIEKLHKENQQLKSRVELLGQALSKTQILIVYQLEQFHDREQSMSHNQAMQQQAMEGGDK